MKCIDADKLKAEIEKRAKFHNDAMKACTGLNNVAITHSAGWKEDTELLTILDSLQQKQPEDVVSTANALLEALSKTPYNNKPITDAQVIVKQLLLFFENPKEYNPDAILEQPEVDLEKFDKDVTNIWGRCAAEPNDSIACFHIETFIEVARHFYELGKKGGSK